MKKRKSITNSRDTRTHPTAGGIATQSKSSAMQEPESCQDKTAPSQDCHRETVVRDAFVDVGQRGQQELELPWLRVAVWVSLRRVHSAMECHGWPLQVDSVVSWSDHQQDIDVDSDVQAIMFGYASEEMEDATASHTPDGNPPGSMR